MPIWSEVLAEIRETHKKRGAPDFDGVRRKYLLELHRHTGRHVILYASGWVQKESGPASMSIGVEDIQALMEVTQGAHGHDLDLILHSPGGSPEAAEAIVSYLRSRFSHIRVIVPNFAMSAATMIACAADEIVLGKHSFLGPTDPQILIPTGLGARWVAAQAVLDQFDKAQEESSDPKKLSAWFPMLNQYGPDLLVYCEAVLNMSRELVKTWLESYMLKNKPDAPKQAKRIADWLANHRHFKSHSRHITRDVLESHGLVIARLEDDEILQDACLSVFHATTHSFSETPTLKIVENHTGRAFIKMEPMQPANVMPIPGVQIAPVHVQPIPPKQGKRSSRPRKN